MVKSASLLVLAWGALAILAAAAALYALHGDPEIAKSRQAAITVAVHQAPPSDRPAAAVEPPAAPPALGLQPQSSELPEPLAGEEASEPPASLAAAVPAERDEAPLERTPDQPAGETRDSANDPATPAAPTVRTNSGLAVADAQPLNRRNSLSPRVERRGTGIGPPWLRFAQPFPSSERRPLVAVVVSRLGLASAGTQHAILALPREVGLSFTPYAHNLQAWVDLARANGHEVLIDLPMESDRAGEEVLGPYALGSDLTRRENLERLRWVMGRAEGLVGATAILGDRFLRHAAAVEPVMEELRRAGFLLVADKDETLESGFMANRLGLPHVDIDSSVNEGLASRLAVDSALALAEARALEQGRALVIAQPFPVSLERLAVWIDGLSARGIALAPVSELALRQQERLIAERQ